MVAGMKGGAYAESVVTRAELLVAKPPGVTFEQSASIPVVALAALLGLPRDRDGLGRGAGARARARFVDPTPTPKSILGSALANPFRSQKHAILMGKPSPEALQWIADRVGDGRLRPVVARSFALTDVQKATRFAEQGGVPGKVVLFTR